TEDDTPADDDWEAEEMDLERDEALDDLVEGPVESDSEWDDLYVGQSGSGSGNGEDDDADAWQQRHVAPVTLQDHLLWQLNLSPMCDRDRVIAGILIDALDHRGYLSLPLDDVIDTAERQISDADDPVEEDEVVAVLHRLQQFDPIGVASRDLAECLGVQLRQQPADTPHLATATALLEHLALLEKHDYAGLRRAMGVTESDLLRSEEH